MKRHSILLIIFLTASLLFGNAVITEWKAEPQSDDIVLQWKTSQEVNVDRFIIERSNDDEHFFNVGEVQARGPGFDYRFVDDQLGRAKGAYYYRLKIMNKDGTHQFTDSLPVIPFMSSITQTWGTIKALFR
ncbi:MAG: hypothetical protein WAN36_05775 [Calditrichia bacterium]